MHCEKERSTTEPFFKWKNRWIILQIFQKETERWLAVYWNIYGNFQLWGRYCSNPIACIEINQTKRHVWVLISYVQLHNTRCSVYHQFFNNSILTVEMGKSFWRTNLILFNLFRCKWELCQRKRRKKKTADSYFSSFGDSEDNCGNFCSSRHYRARNCTIKLITEMN